VYSSLCHNFQNKGNTFFKSEQHNKKKNILFVEQSQDTARLQKRSSTGLWLYTHMHMLIDNEKTTKKFSPNTHHGSEISQQSPAPTATSDAAGQDARLACEL